MPHYYNPANKYLNLKLTAQDIANGDYKKHLGGGNEEWELRGQFQLSMMKELGLKNDNKMLDVGCGPGRASRYLVEYLKAHCYWGVDYQPKFIDIAKIRLEEAGLLESKSPTLDVINDFIYPFDEKQFDICLLFSVLNWCAPETRRKFFLSISNRLVKSGRIVFTHASWFEPSYLWDTPLKVNRTIETLKLDITEYGWPEGQIYPIIELVIAE